MNSLTIKKKVFMARITDAIATVRSALLDQLELDIEFDTARHFYEHQMHLTLTDAFKKGTYKLTLDTVPGSFKIQLPSSIPLPALPKPTKKYRIDDCRRELDRLLSLFADLNDVQEKEIPVESQLYNDYRYNKWLYVI